MDIAQDTRCHVYIVQGTRCHVYIVQGIRCHMYIAQVSRNILWRVMLVMIVNLHVDSTCHVQILGQLKSIGS